MRTAPLQPSKNARNENFPVASWLCPPKQRPAVMALYRYARTADDLADEGQATPSQRLADLAAYRQALDAVLSTSPQQATTANAWPQVFGPLADSHAHWHWPAQPLHDLLDAFEADVRHEPVADDAALLGYCAVSANPVGRLLLHLMPAAALASVAPISAVRAQSDALCTGLQLVNFWQDLASDIGQDRHYLPLSTLTRVGLGRQHVHSPQALAGLTPHQEGALRWAVLHELARAETLLVQGAPLAGALSRTPQARRWGWELRAVAQGGALRLRQLRQALLAGWPLWQQALPRSPGFAAQTMALAWRWPVLQALASPIALPFGAYPSED